MEELNRNIHFCKNTEVDLFKLDWYGNIKYNIKIRKLYKKRKISKYYFVDSWDEKDMKKKVKSLNRVSTAYIEKYKPVPGFLYCTRPSVHTTL